MPNDINNINAADEPDVPLDFRPGTISNFRSSIMSKGGLQIASKYIVEFYTKFGNFVCYPAEVTMPQRALATFDVGQPESLWGTKRKIPVQHEFDEITMSFVVYQDWAERKFLEGWMDNIINKHEYNEEHYEYSNIYFDYVGKIYISTLSHQDQNKITSTFLLDEAYPLSLLPISLSSENTGYVTFVATFAYRKYYFLGV